MMEDINIKINKVKNDIAERNVLEKKLNDFKKDCCNKEEELANLESQLKKELKDVENLKKLSLSSVMSTIMGNKGSKMEKEEQEYLMAKIKYDQCKSRVDLLKEDISSVETRLKSLADCETKYEDLLQIKIHLIDIDGDEVNKKKLINMEKEIDDCLSKAKELDESIVAGNDLANEIIRCKKVLDSAKNWGTIDLFGGDFISSMAKHNKVEEAQRHFTKISNLLSKFNKELKDVNINNLKFSTTSITFDIFFDNIFTDISVNNKINESYGDICKLQGNVERILYNLKEEQSKLNNFIVNKRRDYDEFVNSI
ncbi:MAG: hypothetical protein RSG52_12660 [Terrisporobacter sp.]|uniref:hypothetical protein n=1 Tax=Terrisporobacter sp. TaxID=1965305 RepID=UPI002FC96793